LAFLIRRLLLTLPILFIVSVLCFSLINLIPGDPATVILGPEAPEQAKEQMRERLGLDEPIVVQYVDWLGGVLHGDLAAPFAMGKFALRGLAQSMARELHPQGVHVAHVVVDGGIRSARRPDEGGRDALLDSDAIAQTYLHLIRQHRSAWSWEVEVRPWVETF